MVIGVPMKPDEGVTLNSEMEADGVEGAAIGPARGATPVKAGDVSTMGVVAVATAATFFTTGALALCLCTVVELALEAIITVEQSIAALVRPTANTLALRDFKRFFMAFPSECDIDNYYKTYGIVRS
jgi:hypothetical protein